MKLIHTGRGMGKTTKLIRYSAESGDYIITFNHNSARRIFEMAQKLKLEIPFPLTYQEYLGQHYAGKRISGFLLDDVDLFLQYTSRGVPIHAITITAEADHVD